MSFLTIKLDEEPPFCRRCGNKPRLIGKMLDSKNGETVRMFICRCGELTRTAADLREVGRRDVAVKAPSSI